MEFSFNEHRQMDVVSVSDGKNLGRVCDIAFEFPEGKLRGLFVTGGKGFRFARQEQFIPLASIVKIGEDVIITGECAPREPPCRKPRPCKAELCSHAPKDRRSYDEYE